MSAIRKSSFLVACLVVLVCSMFMAPSAYAAQGAGGESQQPSTRLLAATSDDVADESVTLTSLYDVILEIYDTRTVTPYYDELYSERYNVYSYTMKDRAYTGKQICPAVKVAIDTNEDYDNWFESKLVHLTRGKDYTVAYRNNVNVGTASVIVTGIGEYTGSVTRTFKIGYPISKVSIAKVKPIVYQGKAVKPALKVKYAGKTLMSGTDYKVTYKANTKAGIAKAMITGKGRYVGTKTVSFRITKGSLKKAKVSSVKTQTYTGSAVKPTPTVKLGGVTLKKGVDYTIAYSNNKRVGTAKLTIKGIGSFTGQKTISFKIKRAASKSKTSSGGTVYITDTGAKFHRGSCRWLQWSKHAISRSEAISQGYEACKVCKP